MKEKVISLIKDKMQELDLIVDDVIYEKVNNTNTLQIILDSDKVIDLNLIVVATKIINPILDNANIIKEEYTLDVYSKEKDGKNYEF